jgi:hypothetical protein
VPHKPPIPASDRDSAIIASLARLIRKRGAGDYLATADAHRALARLGVRVRFPRNRTRGNAGEVGR